MTKTWANRPSAARSGTASNAFSPTWAPAKWAAAGHRRFRLARNCADWYQLLDLAARNHVLVSDSGGVYDPAPTTTACCWASRVPFRSAVAPHAGTNAGGAAEQGQTGELALRLPIGYQRLPNGQVILTADEQVQTSIRQVFHLFRRLGSAHAVLGHLQQTGLRLPRQSRNLVGQTIILWDRASYSQVYQILKLPAYAGVYVYGQRRREGLPGAPGTRYGGRLPRPNGKSCSGMPFPAILPGRNIWKTRRNWRKTGRPPLCRPANPRSMAVRGHNPSPPKARREGAGAADRHRHLCPLRPADAGALPGQTGLCVRGDQEPVQ
ncbi:MAG: recombinase family protein [Ardenticatenaceae bacterium]|nr:recombinase family protein [Ardenticatenaceae bacterium]